MGGWRTEATVRPRPAGASPQSADFNQDGRLLATAGTDGTAQLFEAATGRPIGAPIPLAANRWATRASRRELTATEWRDLLPDRAFDRVCG